MNLSALFVSLIFITLILRLLKRLGPHSPVPMKGRIVSIEDEALHLSLEVEITKCRNKGFTHYIGVRAYFKVTDRDAYKVGSVVSLELKRNPEKNNRVIFVR